MNVGFRIPTKVDTEPPERTFDLRQYLNFVWRNWMFIVSVTAFVFLIGVIYLARATPLYTASTQVLLEQREKAPGLEPCQRCAAFDNYSYMENQLAILRSDSLLRRVVIKERLADCDRSANAIAEHGPQRQNRRRSSVEPEESQSIDGNKSPAGSVGNFAQRGRLRYSTLPSLGKIRSEPPSSPTR